MLGLFGAKDSPDDKLRKRVARLVRRAKFSEAAELQRMLCDQQPSDVDGWQALAEFTNRAGDGAGELKALITVAKLERASAKIWLDIANKAKKLDKRPQQADALFRAAEVLVFEGEGRQALSLFDEVLALDATHRMAARLRRLVATKLQQEADDGTIVTDAGIDTGIDTDSGALQKPVTEEHTVTRLRNINTNPGTRTMGLAYDDPSDVLAHEDTMPGWRAPSATEQQESTAQEASLQRYVTTPQSWPTVLQRNPLIFIGPLADLEVPLGEFCDDIKVAAGQTVIEQGEQTEIVYAVRDGALQVSRKLGHSFDLGRIDSGCFFAEIGALMGLPSTTTVTATQDTTLQVVTHKRMAHYVAQTRGIPALIGQLRGWYLDTVFQLCPLSRHDSDRWFAEQSNLRWRTFSPGETLISQGDECELYVILTGVAQVSIETELEDDKCMPIGYICPADLCGELSPSPVKVVAHSAVTALPIKRDQLDQLHAKAAFDLEQRISLCRRALSG